MTYIGGTDLFETLERVSLTDFMKAFDTCSSTAERLELLPAYSVAFEAEAYRSYLDGKDMPDGYNSDWASVVTKAKERGATFSRVRVIPDKPSSYIGFEINWPYRVNTQAGELIQFIYEDEFLKDIEPGVPILDFWIFDRKEIFVIFYDVQGEFLGSAKTDNAKALIWAERLLNVSNKDIKDIQWALKEYASRHN